MKQIRAYPATAILAGLASLLFCARLVSAGFAAFAVLAYPAILCGLVLLCPPLERWVGPKKMWQLAGSTGLFALLTGCAMLLCAGNPLSPALLLGLADGTYLVCLLAGIALSLSVTGGDKPGERFRLRPASWIVPGLLLLGCYCCITLSAYGFVRVPAPDWFFFVYTLSIGAFGGLYFSWQNQVVTNRGVFDRTRSLPPYEKMRSRQFPGTLCLLAAMLAVAMLAVADTPPRDMMLGGFSGWRVNRVVSWTGVNLATLLKGQLWRPFSAGLMHFGPLHLLGNGAALFLAGKYMEPRVGTLKWLCVFFGSVWVNMLPSLFYTNELLYDGASVGIYALVAVFLLYSFAREKPPRSRPYEFIFLLGYVFAGNFISFGAGHFVSFAVGLVAAVVLRIQGKNKFLQK